MKDLVKVIPVNCSALAVATFTNIELVLKVSVLVASLIYTVLKIIEVARRMRREP